MEYRTCKHCGETKEVEANFKWQKGKSVHRCKACRNVLRNKNSKDKKDGTYKKKWNAEELLANVIARSTAVQDILYDFSKAVYVNAGTKIEIRCPKHNITFWQLPGNHMAGKRCPACAKEVRIAKRTSTTGEFLDKAIAVKGAAAFNYTRVNYKGASTEVEIGCNTCGEFFWQTPNTHLTGSGCPKCAKYGYSRERPGSIYLLKNDNITKIGITNRLVEDRVAGISKEKKGFEIIFEQYFEDGSIPYSIEWATKPYLRSEYASPSEKFDGYTECFYDVDNERLIRMIKQHIINIEGMYDHYRPDHPDRENST